MPHTLIADDVLTLPSPKDSSFYYSFSLLPKAKREAIGLVYSFCKRIDDIVDENPSPMPEVIQTKMSQLRYWEEAIEECFSETPRRAFIKPLAKAVKRFDIPKQYFLTLIDGCRRDLIQNRYKTFEELKSYCYSVASVVGLMTIEIFGYKFEDTKNYAINLGYALQLTNILRDVKTDKDRGYIYLPQEDLDKFDYTIEDLKNEVYDNRFIELMRFEAQRAREYFYKARAFLHPEERRNVFAAEVMDAIYYRLLEKIELNEYNVFEYNIRVNNIHKIFLTVKRWLSLHLLVNRLNRKQ